MEKLFLKIANILLKLLSIFTDSAALPFYLKLIIIPYDIFEIFRGDIMYSQF